MASKRPPPSSKSSGDAGDVKRLGKYRVERRLGIGGMGTVFLATDEQLNRPVALKVLPRERANNPTLKRRFKSEGQAAALLQHKNIVSVYEAGEENGYLYLALEYVDGIDVLEWVRKRGRIPFKRTLDIIQQVAHALRHAYHKNIVHRDIKPSNLMIARDGTVKLTDMGLARSIDETLDTSITRDGTTVGTVDYMPPEQAADSKAADIRSDIYALGCTWYHMLTGQPPFPEGGVTNKLTAHAKSQRPDPREFNDQVPEAIVAILHRMMAKKKADRYQNPEELLEDLESDAVSRGANPSGLFALLTEDEQPSSSISVDDQGSSLYEAYISDVGIENAETPPSGHPTPANFNGSGPYVTKEPGGRAGAPDSGSGRSGSADPESRPSTSGHTSSGQTGRGRPTDSGRAETRAARTKSGSSAPDKGATPERSKAKAVTSPSAEREPAAPRETRRSDRRTTVEPTPRRRSLSKGKPLPPRHGESPKQEAERKAANRINFDFVRITTVVLGLVVGGMSVWAIYSYVTRISHESASSEPYAQGPSSPDLPTETQSQPATLELTPISPEDQPSDGDPVSQISVAEQEETAPIVRLSFPGAEDVSGNEQQLKELLPRWVLTGWGTSDPSGLATLEVGRGFRGEDRFVSLPAAVEQAPKSGTSVVVNGPLFAHTPFSAANIKRLSLRARSAGDAMIVVDGSQLTDRGTWFSFSSGILELEGFHFVITRPEEATAKAVRLIELEEADVVLRDCTFTVLGDGTKHVDLLSVTKDSPRGNRVLIENCVTRGSDVTTVRVDSETCDVVAGNCLFGTRDTTAIHCQIGSIKSPPSPSAVRLLGCTVLSDRSGVQLVRRKTNADFYPLHLELRRTLFLSSPSETPTAAILLERWPLTADADLDRPRPQNVTIESAHARFIGWDHLSRMTTPRGDILEASDGAGWSKFWRSSLASDDVITDSVLESEQLGDGLTPATLDNTLGPLARPGVGTRSLLGADPQGLPEPPEPSIERLRVSASRPRISREYLSALEEGKEVRFDLARVATLPRFLNSVPDGSRVVCFGSGLKTLPLLTLQNRRLRLEFEQAAGTPLTLQPKSGTDEEAFLALEGGRIDLVNGKFVIPHSRSRSYPKTFLKVGGQCELSLLNCQITGPSDAPSRIALIDLTGPLESVSRLFVANSVIFSKGPLLQGDLSNRAVELVNSLLVSQDDTFRVSGGTERGSVLLHHCTVSAGRAVVRFSDSSDAPPIDFFVKNTVFAPPLNRSVDATIISVPNDQLIGSSLRWWETACGYAEQIPNFVVFGGSPSGSDFDRRWRTLWGDAHVVDPLYGPQAVLLESVLPGWKGLAATSFRLANACRAAHWSESGGAIGIRFDETLGPDTQPPTADPAAASAPLRRGAPGRRGQRPVQRPDF